MIAVCPKCDVQLFKLLFKEIEVDFCERCRGLWLDAGELEALLEQTGAAKDDPLLEFQKMPGEVVRGLKLFCPQCDQTLRVITVKRDGHSPLQLERCPRGHGLWFDAQELRRLLAMFRPEASASRTIFYLNELLGDSASTHKGDIQ